jgi:hypothetical protein
MNDMTMGRCEKCRKPVPLKELIYGDDYTVCRKCAETVDCACGHEIGSHYSGGCYECDGVNCTIELEREDEG